MARKNWQQPTTVSYPDLLVEEQNQNGTTEFSPINNVTNCLGEDKLLGSYLGIQNWKLRAKIYTLFQCFRRSLWMLLSMLFSVVLNARSNATLNMLSICTLFMRYLDAHFDVPSNVHYLRRPHFWTFLRTLLWTFLFLLWYASRSAHNLHQKFKMLPFKQGKSAE